MTKEDNGKNNVQVSEGILEKLINGLVAKSEPQEPTEPPAQNNNEPVEDENKILEAIGKIDKRLDTMDARITKLEGGENHQNLQKRILFLELLKIRTSKRWWWRGS